MPKKRPETLPSETMKAITEYGSIFITFSYMDEEVYEVFVRRGKVGSRENTLLSCLSDICSDIIQKGWEYKDKIKFFNMHFVGTADDNPFYYKTVQYKSVLDFMGRKIIEKIKAEVVNGTAEEEKAKKK